MAVITNGNINDILAIAPDMRFGNTFLGTKYRDYATAGEVIMDKVSGEIFLKRPIDGKIISFEQNKKYMHELIWELRVLLTNNPNFSYPKEKEDAFFFSLNYDLVAINNEQVINIADGEDTVIDNQSTSDVNRLAFPISVESNGFFCKLMSRDCDKPIIEYLTNQYNKIFENYDGTNPLAIEEKNNFEQIRWKESNAILNYTVIVTDDGGVTKTFDCTENIRINEDILVNIPTININDAFADSTITSIRININSIEYHKLHVLLDNIETLTEIAGEDYMNYFTANFNKFMFKDSRIEVGVFNVMTFVDDVSDLVIYNNETILAMIDVPYTTKYMTKMAQIAQKADIVITVNKPSDEDWLINTIWAERLIDFGPDGIAHKTSSQTDLKLLEHYLSTYGTAETRFSTANPANANDIPVQETEV